MALILNSRSAGLRPIVNILKIISAEYNIDISVIDYELHCFSFDENFDSTSIVDM